MPKKFLIANWKANNNISESIIWLNKLFDFSLYWQKDNALQIILCAPFICLSELKKTLEKKNPLEIALASQNLSPFPEGAYTGEIAASMLTDLVEYAMIGHSERRINFGETDEMINKKVSLAQEANLKTIVCVSNKNEISSIGKKFPEYKDLILYEPISAIGTGKADNPEKTKEIIEEFKEILPSAFFVYGGSVDAENIQFFLDEPPISGVAVGKASLDPLSFWRIIQNAGKD